MNKAKTKCTQRLIIQQSSRFTDDTNSFSNFVHVVPPWQFLSHYYSKKVGLIILYYGLVFFIINGSLHVGLPFPWDLNKIKRVCETLRESLLQPSQSTIFSNSPFMIVTNPFTSRLFKKTFVSSTNEIANNTSYKLAISLIYNRNNTLFETWK